MDADELKKRRAAREEKEKAARAERDLKDALAQDGLEELHGNSGVGVIDLPCAPPLPGIVVIKSPEPSDFKLWQSVMTKPSTTAEKNEAHLDFAASVLLYPEKDTYAAMLAKHPGISVSVTAEAARMAGAGLAQRGKE